MSTTEPATPTPPRIFDDAISDLDNCLKQIKAAADVVIDSATGADIPEDLYRRFVFCARVIDDYAVKADGFMEEAFSMTKRAAAILKGGAA